MLTLDFYAQDRLARSVIPNVLGTELFFTQYIGHRSHAMRSAEQHRPLATGEDTAINRCCFSSDIYRLSVNVFGLMAE